MPTLSENRSDYRYWLNLHTRFDSDVYRQLEHKTILEAQRVRTASYSIYMGYMVDQIDGRRNLL